MRTKCCVIVSNSILKQVTHCVYLSFMFYRDGCNDKEILRNVSNICMIMGPIAITAKVSMPINGG